MSPSLKQRVLGRVGDVARRVPSDRAQLFSFVASPRARAEPWKLYQRLHARGPIRPGPMGTWLVASHAGVSTVLRHPNTSVDETRAAGISAPPHPGAFTRLMRPSLLFTDPPDHQRLRRLVSKTFTPGRIAAMEPSISDLAQELLEPLRDRGRGDLITEFALPFPVAVITDLLGIPTEDQDQFLTWARHIAPGLDVDLFRDLENERRADRAAEQLAAYLGNLIDDPGSRHPDGLIAGLADIHHDGDRLDRAEIIALCALLLVAGFETTTNLIANSVVALLDHPVQLELLRTGAVSTTTAVEELLRHAGPIQFTQRVLLEDLELDGHTIPSGTLVALLIGAANRDPAVFTNPDRLDLRRDPNPHLSFSFGIHHCLGAALARLEAAIAIPAILHSLPQLRPLGRPQLRRTFVIRGYSELAMQWHPPEPT